MPRFFFHVHVDDHVQRDSDGIELPSVDTAVAQAEQARVDILTEDELDELWLEIADESGHVLAKVE